MMAVIDQSLIVADALVVGREDATAGKRCSRAHRLCVCGACALGNSIILTGDRSVSPHGVLLVVVAARVRLRDLTETYRWRLARAS